MKRLRPALEWLRRDGWLGAVELGLALAVLGCLLGFRDLPMVDLPQHAAQIATWERWDAHVPEVVQRFELNFRTPYLFAYPFARALAPLFGAVVALKLVVWLALVGNLVTVRALARRLGHEPWLGLLGLVTSVGICFYFGFVSFLLAMPLAVGSLLLGLDHARAPRVRSGAALAFVQSLLLTAHGIAFVMGFGATGLLLLRGGRSLAARLLPLGAPALLGLLWIAPGPVSTRIGGDVWDLSFARLPDLAALLVSMGARDHVGTALGVAVLAVAAFTLGRRAVSGPERWLPLALLLVAYACFPAMFRGIVLLHTRLPCFLLPLWLLALAPRAASAGTVRLRRGAILGVTLLWLGLFAVRLAAFNREAAPFHELTRSLEPGLAVRPLIFERETRVFPGVPAYLHYSAYYYVEKGGSQGYSFAQYALSVVRYRPEVTATMRDGAEWRPDRFRREETSTYDAFLVRDERDRQAELFADGTVELRAHVGPWWAYLRREPALARVEHSVVGRE